MLNKVKSTLKELIHFGLLLVVLAILAEILFGPDVPFVGIGVVDNLTTIMASMGNAGVAGIVAIAIVLYLFKRNYP